MMIDDFRSGKEPVNFDHEGDEGYEETKDQPEVDHLEVSRPREGVVDALVHGVHDEHDGQGKSDGKLVLALVEEKGHLCDDKQAAEHK